MAISAMYYRNPNDEYAGAAFVFDRDPVTRSWTQSARLLPTNGDYLAAFGHSLDLHDDRLVVGAYGRTIDGKDYAGATYLYHYRSSWTLDTVLQRHPPVLNQNFGYQVALASDQVAVSAPADDGSVFQDGTVYFYARHHLLPTATLDVCTKPTLSPPTATDACDGSITGTTTAPTTFYRAGRDTLTYTFTDGHGNRAVALQPVQVNEENLPLPYHEDVEGATGFLDCWTTLDVHTDGSWAPLADAERARQGTFSFYLPASTANPQQDELRSPPFPGVAGTDHLLSFSFRAGAAGTAERLSVWLVDAVNDTLVTHLSTNDFDRADYRTIHLRFRTPDAGTYRLVFTGQSAGGSQGIHLDDIALSLFAAPADGAATLAGQDDDHCLTASGEGVFGGQVWSRIVDPTTGRLLAEINPNGNDLGDVTVNLTDYSAVPTAPFAGQPLLSRYLNITPERGGASYTKNGGVHVRLYFTDAELAQYNTAVGRNFGWNSLAVTHYDDVNTDCDLHNSTGDYLTEAVTATGDYGSSAHYLEFVTQSFSEFGAASQTAMPVTLTHFAATAAGPVNRLTWQVAREESFSHYTVERSTDGMDFDLLTEVAGSGRPHYTADDAAPTLRTYYRLRMVDLDGSEAYSRVVSVDRQATKLSAGTLKAYPIPTIGSLTLRFTLTQSEPVEVQVYDAMGRLVLRQQYIGRRGTNEQLLTVDALPPGGYSLRLVSSQADWSMRITKF